MERHMGNENEIVEIRKTPRTDHFLPDDVVRGAEGQLQIYSLEGEYKKTKKNRNIRPYIILGLFLTVLAALAALAFAYFRMTEKQIQVIVTEFQGTNLKEILESAKNGEARLAGSRKALAALFNERDKKITEARKQGKTREEIAAIESDYAKKIRQEQEEVNRLEEQVAQANRQIREGMDRALNTIDNSDRLTQIKIDQLTALYNPTLTGRMAGLLSKRVPPGGGKPSGGYRPELGRAGLSEKEFAELRELSSDHEKLIKVLKDVPYTNSMPDIIGRLGDFQGRMERLYDRTMYAFADSSRAQNERIDSYLHAFEYLTKTQPETGYVIDSRNTTRIRIYMNPVIRLQPGDRAGIFRKDDELIGEIEFVSVQGEPIAKIVSIEKDKIVQPFDRILINYRRQQP